MKRTQPLTLLIIFSIANGAAMAQNASSQVVSVGDGDTLRVNISGKTETIRMACIDAPERLQTPYGKTASGRLKQLLSCCAAKFNKLHYLYF